jgi:chromosome segregation ATPase
MEKYRKEKEEKIEANTKSILEFNERISKEKKEAREEYTAKIAALEQKNSDLKKKMDDYKADGKESWETFKAEFTHDMDELGKAIVDLQVKNVK